MNGRCRLVPGSAAPIANPPSCREAHGFTGSAVEYLASADIGDHHELGSSARRVH